MKKQIQLSPPIRLAIALGSASLLVFVMTFLAVHMWVARSSDTVAALSQNSPQPYELLGPPTASVTSSITNGVYVQDTKSNTFRKVTQNTMATQSKTNIDSSVLSVSVAPTTPLGPKTLKGMMLYVNPTLRQEGRQERIASQPTGQWFGGWNADVTANVSRTVTAATQAGSVPTLVAYNIPARDCGSYSAGGANSSSAYRTWIQNFANGIGGNRAIVIVEPDALPGLDCLSSSNQQQRLSDIAFAVSVLAKTGATTYLDAGNYSWQSASTMAQRLKAANVASARGVSLNVSGYGWTDKTIAYGQQLVGALGGNKGFVMDTSRNGQGPAPNNEWCNPRGRGLGLAPSTSTGVSGLDAYLWVKVPGESDGACNGGPSAGVWWDEIANELIANARQ